MTMSSSVLPCEKIVVRQSRANVLRRELEAVRTAISAFEGIEPLECTRKTLLIRIELSQLADSLVTSILVEEAKADRLAMTENIWSRLNQQWGGEDAM